MSATTRREWLANLLIGGGAVAATGGVYAGMNYLNDPRRDRENQLRIPPLEEIDGKLNKDEIAFRLKIFEAVRDENADDLKKLLDSKILSDAPSAQRAIEIVAHPFDKALTGGSPRILEPFLDRFPKLANAVMDSYYPQTTMERAFSEERQDNLKFLAEKGARFELAIRPENFVSTSAGKGDLNFLTYLNSQKGFEFPKDMTGYESDSKSSPFKRLIDGAEFYLTEQKTLIDIAKLLESKGYNPLESQGSLGYRKNAIEFAQERYDFYQKSIDNGTNPDAPWRNFFGANQAEISPKQAQANLTALMDHFKSLGKEQATASHTAKAAASKGSSSDVARR